MIKIDAFPINSNWSCETCNLNTGAGVVVSKVYLIGQGTATISIPTDAF